MIGKTYIVVSELGVACLIIRIKTEHDKQLLERIREIATVHERRPFQVKFAHHGG